MPEIHTLKSNLLIAYFTKPLKQYGLALMAIRGCLVEYPADIAQADIALTSRS
jgi:hypothetical protein